MSGDWGWKQVAFEVDANGIGRLVTRDIPGSEMYEDDLSMSDDEKPWDKVKIPTDEQLEQFLKLAGASGINPAACSTETDKLMKLILFSMLNKDKILGFGHDR